MALLMNRAEAPDVAPGTATEGGASPQGRPAQTRRLVYEDRGAPVLVEAQRLVAIERRLLVAIQWVVFGAVLVLTIGAGALSWEHLTHIAATNGHIAPRHLLFLFPSIVDGFMVASSAVVVRHALTDELGRRTWYAGGLVAATASLSVCLNIQDSTGRAVLPEWMLPGIAPTLYMLGTELGLAELRLLMRRLRLNAQTDDVPGTLPEKVVPSKKEAVLAALAEVDGHVPTVLRALAERGIGVDRSYVYEIKRNSKLTLIRIDKLYLKAFAMQTDQDRHRRLGEICPSAQTPSAIAAKSINGYDLWLLLLQLSHFHIIKSGVSLPGSLLIG